MFAYTLWRIWKWRNETVFNKTKFDPTAIATTISEAVDVFNMAKKMCERATQVVKSTLISVVL